MWISRDEYDSLKEKCDCMEGRYLSQKEVTNELIQSLNAQYYEVYNLKEQLKQMEVYKQESEEYKLKYADEVQKRLELVKLIENTP